jgi:FMN phosphatase YigB (HAD superfamily)
MIKAIAFDVGNVLLRLNYDRMVASLARAGGGDPRELAIKMARLLEDYDRHTSLYADFELGKLSSESFIEHFNSQTDLSIPAASFADAWNDLFDENLVLARLAGKLKGQLPLMLLSNTNPLHADRFLVDYSVMDIFQHRVLSYQVKAMKPDEAIYQAALATLDLAPDELFFIEDRQMNIDGARALGINAFLYADNDEELRVALQEEGLKL